MGRRVAGDGGLTRKTRRWPNKETGEITEHSYWEASAEVPADQLDSSKIPEEPEPLTDDEEMSFKAWIEKSDNPEEESTDDEK